MCTCSRASELTKHHGMKFNDRLIERDGRQNKTYQKLAHAAHAACGRRSDGLLHCLPTSSAFALRRTCIYLYIKRTIVVDYTLIAV